MFERLDYIMAISEEQNITRAAKRLFISQPALTKYINKLEEEYDTTLFDRSRSPITLTEAGRLFLSEKIQIEIAEQNLRHKLELLKSGKISLTLGTGYVRAHDWFPRVFEKFCNIHPDINLRLINSGELVLLNQLRSGGIDLAVGAFDTKGTDFECRYLTVEKLRLLVPLSYGIFPDGFSPEASVDHPYLLKPEQLNGFDYISPEKTTGSYNSYQILQRQYSIKIRREIVTNSIRALKDMILLGLGYGFTVVNVSSDLQNKEGQFVAGCCILPSLPTWRITSATYNPTHPHSSLLKELVDILEQQIINSNSQHTCYWKYYQDDISPFV